MYCCKKLESYLLYFLFDSGLCKYIPLLFARQSSSSVSVATKQGLEEELDGKGKVFYKGKSDEDILYTVSDFREYM